MSGPPILRLAGRRREEIPEAPWRWLLAPAWAAYATAVALRALAYDRGWLPMQRAPVPVLSVGNVVAGGSGKTPVALWLARWLREQGRRPAILARGYRGEGGANDEARLAADIPVLCDPDRVRGARLAIAAGADCLILDDGLQHRRLHRDLDLLVIDATRPWGADDGGPGWLLPLGYRRDLRRAVARCQAAWISRAHLAPARAEALAAELAAQGLTVVRAAAPAYRFTALDGRPCPPPAGAALLVSGIGHPAAFEADAARAGLAVRASLRFPDHHRYRAADVAAILQHAAGAAVVTTAKDAVKLATLWPPGHAAAVLHADAELLAEDRARLAAVLARTLARSFA